jgi:RNA polymerase sigma factor (sigma-70 family)
LAHSGYQRRNASSQGLSFDTTQWSVVVAAGQPQHIDRQQALAMLCERYWHPLYAYLRRQGHPADRAQDLTQEFFCRLLEKNWIQDAQRERGRFRGFLLAALKHFLANEWDRAHAQKRGGHAVMLSLDFSQAENGPGFEPSHDMTPERAFERSWALAVLEHTLVRLRGEYAAAGKDALFEALKPALTAEQPMIPLKELGERLGMSEGAVKVAVHRLRQRYRAALRQEIAQTVAEPTDIDAEIRDLFAALGG